LVDEDVTLFNDTIAANIAYATITQCTQDALEKAAISAHVMEFIGALPQGFNTVVGENGIRLSRAQRQRLAIARDTQERADFDSR
jgi:subfamily B ATP-binding cassette protein MsbA